MDKTQIDTALNRLFHEQGKRIVFWNDPQREFEDTLATLAVPDIQVLRLDQAGALSVKIRLERDDTEGRYLIYSPTPEPDYDNDWLLDIRLYSHTFRADRASIILDELGLVSQAVRPHIEQRKRFFDNKERFRKLQSMVSSQDTEIDLDRKMLAALVKADQPDPFAIVLALFHSLAGFPISGIAYGSRTKASALREGESSPSQPHQLGEGADDSLFNDKGEPDLAIQPPAWELVAKLGLDGAFWQMVKTSFGYTEETPSLRNLLIRLLVTDYAHHLNGPLPTALQHLVLPATAKQNVVACLSHWRDSASRGGSYDRLSGLVADILKLDSHLDSLDIDALLNVMTFLPVEKAIARSLRDRVRLTADSINADDIRKIALRRQDGHWASLTVSPASAPSSAVPRRALHGVYDALVSAADFYALRNEYLYRLDFADAATMYRAYERELYRFDQLYRHFCESADQAESEGWGVLKPLRLDIEAVYGTWFIATLGLAWGKFVDPKSADGLLNRWTLDGVPNQHRFYDDWIKNRPDRNDGRKVYVIISDAFRYEAAQELTRELNGKYRFEAKLSSQLSVLPSYTALGMAGLLPHKTLAYKATGEVLVDGKLTSSMPLRNEILSAVGGIAVKGEDLQAMSRDAGREFVREHSVVYVYHNTVDAIGDHAATESRTFDAVRQTINEVASLVGHIVNNLNGSLVLVTADHGFLFQETTPAETDKSALAEKPDSAVIAKKRYLLGQALPDHESTWHGHTSITAQAEGDMEFWIPKGANRFHFVGGARFIHGGAMLQEIVVPIVEVRHIRGKAAPTTKSKHVAVHVLGTHHKITAPRHRFEFLQTEAVTDRMKAITLKVAVYEGDEPVTNIETVTFDSASDNMNDRKKWVSLVLLDRQYSKQKIYRLVLREAETGIEQQSVNITIDRAITDDF